MTKQITDSQILGELGETAIKKLVLEMQFIYDPRGRLEAGTDGIIELRDPKSGAPLGKLLGVQVKATESSQYIREAGRSFEYLLKPDDLKYWRGSNELCGIFGDGVNQAADFFSDATSIPSRNVTPLTTFGN